MNFPLFAIFETHKLTNYERIGIQSMTNTYIIIIHTSKRTVGIIIWTFYGVLLNFHKVYSKRR